MSENSEGSRKTLWFGIAATLLVAAIAIFVVLTKIEIWCAWGDSCEINWIPFTSMGFNEIGDALAGVAGSLAFIWIIVAVFMQKEELAMQRDELELTREEIRGQSEIMAEQLSMLERENSVREYAEADKELVTFLTGLSEVFEPEPLGTMILLVDEKQRYDFSWPPLINKKEDRSFKSDPLKHWRIAAKGLARRLDTIESDLNEHINIATKRESIETTLVWKFDAKALIKIGSYLGYWHATDGGLKNRISKVNQLELINHDIKNVIDYLEVIVEAANDRFTIFAMLEKTLAVTIPDDWEESGVANL